MKFEHAFEGALRLYSTETAAWHFVTVPQEASSDIKSLSAGMRSAFGSLRVTAKIGKTTWKTSLFLDSKANAFLLPVKAEVRKKESLTAGDAVRVSLEFEI